MADFRVIPSIEQLLQREAIRSLERTFGRGAIVEALRQAAAELRRALSSAAAAGEGVAGVTDPESAARFLEHGAREALAGASRPSLRPVVNATGVVIHTNLGRAPLAQAALQRIAQLGAGYSNLEYDLADGRRGRRDVHAEALLQRLVGAEAAVVVNNNASAMLLVLAALASGREVVVSRGELVEIGGGFRVPDVMAQSGATLREVGTTNKTRLSDYSAAITEHTGLLLRVHRSNFRIEGFTEQPTIEALTALGHEAGIPVAEDLGSGFIGLPGDAPGSERLDALLGGEPKVQASLAAGMDVCCFSGDKLLGGPQAGIVVGRSALVDRIRRHPLMRAVRVDKLTYAALEATLGEYVAGRAARTVPSMRMILASAEEIGARAEVVARLVAAASEPGTSSDRTPIVTEIIEGLSTIGGGTTPGLQFPTRLLAVSIEGHGADDVAARLRQHDPPVIGRIAEDRLVLDLRTVLPEQDAHVAEALSAAGLRTEDNR